MLLFSSKPTCFEKEESWSKDVKQHSNKAKNASKTFHDILPKEQFHGVLWEWEFGIKKG
jgi:hypothetical protein